MNDEPAPDFLEANRVRFIQEHLALQPVPTLEHIRLHTASSASGLRHLPRSAAKNRQPPPYWAWQWAGGMVLARYLLDHPQVVAGRRVLDLGAGSGLVAIAAAKAGARSVIAADIDPIAAAAIALNAEANSVAVSIATGDPTENPPPEVDVIMVGDLFYERGLARRVTAFLDRCLDAGIAVLIGDPGRAHLPRARLRIVAEYAVPDFGDAKGAALKPSAVFALIPAKG